MSNEPDAAMLEAVAYAMVALHFIHPAEAEIPEHRKPRRFLEALRAEGYEITRKSDV